MTGNSPATMGWVKQLAVDASGSFSGSSECYDFVSCGIKAKGEVIDHNMIRGTRSHASERTRYGLVRVGGPLVLNPSTADLRNWWPRVLGASETGTGPYTYAVAETLPSFSVLIAKSAKDFQYDGCYVNSLTLRGRAGEPIDFEFDIQGKTETPQNSGTFAALNLTEPSGSFYVFYDGAATIGGTAYYFKDFELKIDNMLDLERFFNSQTRVQLPPQDRIVTLRITTPWTTDETGIYSQALAQDAVVLTFTNGSHIMTITLAAVAFNFETPDSPDKSEVLFPLEGQCRAVTTGSPAKEIVVTIASP